MVGWRNTVAALAVFAGLLALVVAPAVAARLLPGERVLSSPDRLDIGYGASLLPPTGARLDVDASRPGMGEVVLRVAGLTARFTAVAVRGPASGYVTHARHRLARDEALRAGPPEPASTEHGVTGQRSALTGDDEGCVWIFVAGTGRRVAVGLTAVVLGTGCAGVPAELTGAVRSLVFEPSGAP